MELGGYWCFFFIVCRYLGLRSMDLAVVAAGEVQNVLSAMQKNLECPIWYGRGSALGLGLLFFASGEGI